MDDGGNENRKICQFRKQLTLLYTQNNQKGTKHKGFKL